MLPCLRCSDGLRKSAPEASKISREDTFVGHVSNSWKIRYFMPEYLAVDVSAGKDPGVQICYVLVANRGFAPNACIMCRTKNRSMQQQDTYEHAHRVKVLHGESSKCLATPRNTEDKITYNQPNRPKRQTPQTKHKALPKGQPGRRITPINTAAVHASAQQQPTISTHTRQGHHQIFKVVKCNRRCMLEHHRSKASPKVMAWKGAQASWY